MDGEVAEEVAAVDEPRAKRGEAGEEREEVEVSAPCRQVQWREVLRVENVRWVVVPHAIGDWT